MTSLQKHSGYDDHTCISSIRYAQPALGCSGAIFSTKENWMPKIDPDNIAYRTLFEPYNLLHFLSTRLPIDMGLTELNSPAVNVLRMPLKFPGTTYQLPAELDCLKGLIQRVASYEAVINPYYQETFCHLTFDKSIVEPGTYHRFPGWHGDGIQGTRLTPKINIEHSYILSSAPPTEFCLQPFFLKHLDEAKHNFFYECDKQAREVNIFKSLPNHLYLIDPYMVHRTPKILETTERIFLRITYAFSELQHPKNTINPMFAEQVYEQRIEVRENLSHNEFPPPYHLYGLSL